jgi:hypothetical protein
MCCFFIVYIINNNQSKINENITYEQFVELVNLDNTIEIEKNKIQ